MLKVAIVGPGSMGVEHSDAWSRVPEATIVAVCGRNPDNTQRLAERFGAKAYESFQSMMESTPIDVVDICLPTYLHKSYITQAAHAGKHIICEKPLALDPGEARDMIDLCESLQVKLFVGHDLRFSPEYRQAREQVMSGRLGRIGHVSVSRQSYFPKGGSAWYSDSSKSGGVIMDLLIHDFDWLRWTFGEVERVTTLRSVRSDAVEPLEYALVAVLMQNGILAHVEGSWAHTEFSSSFEIAGTKGMITEKSRDSVPLSIHYRLDQEHLLPVAVPMMTLYRNTYDLELEHFADCILHDKQPLVTAFDAMKAVEIARSAIISAETGRPVYVSVKEERS